MARARKRRKKAPRQLWVARDQGSEDVSFFKSKPTMQEVSTCGECGKAYDGFVARGGTVGDDICESGFADITGIKVAEGEAIQLKVTRVED